jgi:hypothetical protein
MRKAWKNGGITALYQMSAIIIIILLQKCNIKKQNGCVLTQKKIHLIKS